MIGDHHGRTARESNSAGQSRGRDSRHAHSEQLGGPIRRHLPLRCGWRPGTVDDVADGLMTLFFCGDVMLGRGVDQVLPHPGDPELRERYAGDARAYVRLAERANGPIPRPADFSWPWGDALDALDGMAPDVRVINLETSVTRSAEFAPDKPVHYRMSPENLPAVTVARPDACALANNHVLDFGHTGLRETLDTLASADLAAVGSGSAPACPARTQRSG